MDTISKRTAIIKRATHFIVLIITFSILYSPFGGATLNSFAQSSQSVSAVIPPAATDFQFSFAYHGDSLVHQDQTITYDITYGANESAGFSTKNVITVNYSNDTAPDKSYLVDYVWGSATEGYGGTKPVIDTKTRTITWTLPPLPKGTMDQKVSFKLGTNGDTHDLKRLTFRNRAALGNEYVTLPDYGLQQDYVFDRARVTPAPTVTPGLQATTIPTIDAVRFQDVSFTQISTSEATVGVTTSKPTKITIRYGTSPTALTEQMRTNRFTTYNLVSLPKLLPNLQYYLQILATDEDGKTIGSDIITFTSATTHITLLQDKDAYTITSGDTVLLSNILNTNTDSSGFLLLPINTSYKLTYTFASLPNIRALETIVRNDLGILQEVQMVSADDKTYIAYLRTGSPGIYTIEVRQYDEAGNIMSRKISRIRVASHMWVLEANGKEPLADARVYLSKLNAATNQYEGIEDSSTENPIFTDLEGKVNSILPSGKYRAQVSAFGFKDKTVDFNIAYQNGDYPTIYMESDLTNIASLFTNIQNLSIDTLELAQKTVASITNSIRAFAAVALAALGASISMGFMMFNARTELPYKEALTFAAFQVAVLRNKHKETFLFGGVVDKSGQPIGSARIEFVHIRTGIVLAHTTTTKAGTFRVPNSFDVPFIKLVATKEGHPQVAMIIPTDIQKPITVRIDQAEKTAKTTMVAGVRHIASGFFEIILILSLIVELLFIESFGVAKTLPFILLTLFNLALWVFYQKEQKLHKL
jgi:hypothetical protein